MPNVQAGFGLRAVRHLGGGEIRENEYHIASGYATSIYRGDPVQQAPDGSIIIAEAGNVDNIGVFNGVHYVDANGNQKFAHYWPGGIVATEIKAHIYDDPMIIFQIQSDATGVADVDLGSGADWEIVAGDARFSISGTNLDVSAGLAATAKSLRILRIVEDNENVAGPFAIVEVMFNEHVLKGVVSGVGGI